MKTVSSSPRLRRLAQFVLEAAFVNVTEEAFHTQVRVSNRLKTIIGHNGAFYNYDMTNPCTPQGE